MIHERKHRSSYPVIHPGSDYRILRADQISEKSVLGAEGAFIPARLEGEIGNQAFPHDKDCVEVRPVEGVAGIAPAGLGERTVQGNVEDQGVVE